MRDSVDRKALLFQMAPGTAGAGSFHRQAAEDRMRGAWRQPGINYVVALLATALVIQIRFLLGNILGPDALFTSFSLPSSRRLRWVD